MYSGIQVGELLDEIAISDIIRNLYETEYFSSIKVSFESGVVYFDLKENPIVNNIYIDGSKLLSYDKIKNDLKTKSRGVYTKYKIKYDVDNIKLLYQRLGYISAIVEPKVVFLSDNRVDIVFEVEDGEAATVKKINIHGNNSIFTEDLLNLIPIKQKKAHNPFSSGDKYENNKITTGKDNIINFYKENGFVDVKIDDVTVQYARDAGDVAIDIYITENEKYSIRNVTIDTSVADVKVEPILLNKPENVYNYMFSRKDIINIKDALYMRGFGYLSVEEKIANKENGKLDLIYLASDEEVRSVSSIVINGNKKTMDYVIRRELLFSEGSTLIPKDLLRSESRLRSLGYFKKIEIKQVPKNSKESVVYIELEEEDRRGNINFSAGYSSFEGKVLSYGFSVFNVFGKGYDFNTSFSTSRIMKSFNIGLHTMRFGDSKFGGGLDLGFSNFDATPYGVNYTSKSYYIAPSLSYRLGDNLFHTISYSYRQDNMQRAPASDASYLRTLLMDQFTSIETSSIINSVFYDTRDNFVLPTTGNRLGITQTIAGFGGTQKFFKHDVELTTYQQFFGKRYPTMFSLKAGNITSYGGSDVLFQNRYAVWYYNMRGFGYGGIGPRLVETKENGSQYVDVLSYRGNNYGIFTFEQHFPVPFAADSGVVWYLFSDFATLYSFDGKSTMINSLGNTEEIVESRKIRNASGIGIAFPSPMGVIRLDYSAYINKAKYDSTQVFRISIGGMPMM